MHNSDSNLKLKPFGFLAAIDIVSFSKETLYCRIQNGIEFIVNLDRVSWLDGSGSLRLSPIAYIYYMHVLDDVFIRFLQLST